MSKITQKEIDSWKEQYGGVYKFPVDDKVAYLREPKMKDYKRSFSVMQNDGDLAFGEEMIGILFIGGDLEIKNDDAYFLPARKKIIKLFNYDDPEVETKNGQTKITISGFTCTVRKICREDIKISEKKNPNGKPFVTQEKLFERVCVNQDDAFNDKENASIRIPLYQAIEELQNQKVAYLEKL